MAQVASAVRRQNLSLTSLLRTGWARFVKTSNRALSKGIYSEDMLLTDSLERELASSELHPYTF